MKIHKLWGLVILALLLLPVQGMAEEEGEDIEVFDLELEEVLHFGSAILAIILFILTYVAYTRTNNARLKYVSVAFILFAIKGFLNAAELFIEEWAWIDPITSILEFAILLTFFYGIIKK